MSFTIASYLCDNILGRYLATLPKVASKDKDNEKSYTNNWDISSVGCCINSFLLLVSVDFASLGMLPSMLHSDKGTRVKAYFISWIMSISICKAKCQNTPIQLFHLACWHNPFIFGKNFFLSRYVAKVCSACCLIGFKFHGDSSSIHQ